MENTGSSGEAASDLMKIALNTVYLCLVSAVRHIEEVQSAAQAAEFKSGLLAKLKDGRIDAALFEDAALYDYVVDRLEPLLSEAAGVSR